MIKLSEIKAKFFEIELPDGTIKKFDLIDLIKDLSQVLSVEEGLDPALVIENIDKIKSIFDLEITGSQAISLLKHVEKDFYETFGEIDEVKKKGSSERLTSVQGSGGSTEGTSEIS